MNSICAMKGWSLQRLAVVPAGRPGMGMAGSPQVLRRDYGSASYVPFSLILPPDNDEGFDLAVFLGFLFASLGLPSNPTMNLLCDAKVLTPDPPIAPGIGKSLQAKGISRKDVEEVLEKLWQKLQPALSATKSGCT